MYGLLVLILASAFTATLIAALPALGLLSEHLEVLGNVFLFFLFLWASAEGYLLSAWGRPPPSTLTIAAHSLSSVMCRLALFVRSTVRNVGLFPEHVDGLFRDEGRRSALASEYAKLRTEYDIQCQKIGTLNDAALEVCKERNHMSHDFESGRVFASRRRPCTHPVKHQEVSAWREPSTLAKLFQGKDLKVDFLSTCVDELRSAVLANPDLIRQAQSMLEAEEADLRRVVHGIAEGKRKAAHDQRVAEERAR
ncbi:hypothetical protein BT67DRAFT_444991 [Trichocladium antarcticum]|uniref:Uncharacterized protein n=1 Tax=Trichocladium antarcticum TaxID=1450529 RepID=A0AAN6UED5_9PEZI|nr:hypothetical protein BT67DRAFT_444991 [Trichocladium antarcticum]